MTYLVENQLVHWTDGQIGWLIGIPVLSGSVFRLPVGLLTDKFGGKWVFVSVMLVSSIPMYLLSFADSYEAFLGCSLGFGMAGTSFAVGIAYTSVWFSREHQGKALGIFGAGNAGAALTSMGAPYLLRWLTEDGAQLEAWRTLPRLYAGALIVMTVIFALLAAPKRVDDSHITSFAQRFTPLRHMRVWRFGLYYFLVFGGFVALAQWLIPYYVSVYTMPLATAGLLASIFSLPSGVIRALGGYLSDHFGARRVMYWVLGSCLVCCALLIVPRMDIHSPGKTVLAKRGGTVTMVTPGVITVDALAYPVKANSDDAGNVLGAVQDLLIWPAMNAYQEPVVSPGQVVKKKELLARGVTHIYFQANVWVFTGLLFIVGIMMGIGKAAVYKHIPDYFPKEVGVVGGIVGVLGGLGGFFCPIIFGYLLEWTGLWTTCWMFFTALSAVCLWWMHKVVQRAHYDSTPALRGRMEQIDQAPAAVTQR